jgi:hypothetical protein
MVFGELVEGIADQPGNPAAAALAHQSRQEPASGASPELSTMVISVLRRSASAGYFYVDA